MRSEHNELYALTESSSYIRTLGDDGSELQKVVRTINCEVKGATEILDLLDDCDDSALLKSILSFKEECLKLAYRHQSVKLFLALRQMDNSRMVREARNSKKVSPE